MERRIRASWKGSFFIDAGDRRISSTPGSDSTRGLMSLATAAGVTQPNF